jgi:hypothetical protein
MTWSNEDEKLLREAAGVPTSRICGGRADRPDNVLDFDPLEGPAPMRADEEEERDELRAQRDFWILAAVIGWICAFGLMAVRGGR